MASQPQYFRETCELCGGPIEGTGSKVCAKCRQAFQTAPAPTTPKPPPFQVVQAPQQQGQSFSGTRIVGCLGLIFFLVFGFLVPYAWIGCVVCLVMCLKSDTKPPPPPTIIYVNGP